LGADQIYYRTIVYQLSDLLTALNAHGGDGWRVAGKKPVALLRIAAGIGGVDTLINADLPMTATEFQNNTPAPEWTGLAVRF